MLLAVFLYVFFSAAKFNVIKPKIGDGSHVFWKYAVHFEHPAPVMEYRRRYRHGLLVRFASSAFFASQGKKSDSSCTNIAP